MKNTLQGINSGVDEAEDQTKDLEGKEVENTQSEQKKRIKKMRTVQGASGTTSRIPTSVSWVCQTEKRESKTLKTYLND